MTDTQHTAQKLADELKRLVAEYGEALVQRKNFPRRDKIHAAIDRLAALASQAESEALRDATDMLLSDYPETAKMLRAALHPTAAQEVKSDE